MPPFDWEGALRRADTALRHGRLDAAIAEYERVVEARPHDWNSANTLGDLYVRTGDIDRAVAQYTRVADHLAGEGFYAKAAALFKKVLKVKPADEYALRQSGDIAARQGLGGDRSAVGFVRMTATLEAGGRTSEAVGLREENAKRLPSVNPPVDAPPPAVDTLSTPGLESRTSRLEASASGEPGGEAEPGDEDEVDLSDQLLEDAPQPRGERSPDSGQPFEDVQATAAGSPGEERASRMGRLSPAQARR